MLAAAPCGCSCPSAVIRSTPSARHVHEAKAPVYRPKAALLTVLGWEHSGPLTHALKSPPLQLRQTVATVLQLLSAAAAAAVP
mmetsp:Transcript_22462/g.49104  ORF Transcript_22462/g.49104 Transcript_22462/m.49104 type:complete len:83 (-) Transcript_22462:1922-2170(-)